MWNKALPVNKTVTQMVKQFPAFYRIWNFVTVMKMANYCFLSRDDDSRSDRKEVSRFLWNLNFHYCDEYNQSLFSILIPPIPVHSITLSFLRIHSMLQWRSGLLKVSSLEDVSSSSPEPHTFHFPWSNHPK